MAIGSGSAKMSDVNLTSLVVGILSIPGAILELKDFRMVSISLGATTGRRYRNRTGL